MVFQNFKFSSSLNILNIGSSLHAKKDAICYNIVRIDTASLFGKQSMQKQHMTCFFFFTITTVTIFNAAA